MSKRKRKSVRRKPTSKALVSTAVAVPAGPEHPLAIIERVAKDKTVDVEKLGQLIELQKDLMRVQAKADFENAFSTLAPLLPVITKRGVIKNKDGSKRFGYARLGEDIHPVIKPLLAEHGFAIRHRTEWPSPGLVRVVGVLSHRSGHSEESAFEGPADSSEYRTHTQSLGSTIHYGRRYTTTDLLNLTLHGVDDDGSLAPRQERQTPLPPVEWKKPTAADMRNPILDDAPMKQSSTSPAPSGAQETVIRRSDLGMSVQVSEAQAKRLYMIVKNSGRDERQVKAWLGAEYRAASYREVQRRDYDAICNAVEAPGVLPGRRG